jgi:hypothetical protein
MFVLAALSITKDPTTMKDNATGSLDRRDFVIASLAAEASLALMFMQLASLTC